MGAGSATSARATRPGVIVSGLTSRTNALTVSFGDTPGDVGYKGLAPNFVGLYPFNMTVPNVTDFLPTSTKMPVFPGVSWAIAWIGDGIAGCFR
jgi:uncharacterized protein (TIGR03437 family)